MNNNIFIFIFIFMIFVTCLYIFKAAFTKWSRKNAKRSWCDKCDPGQFSKEKISGNREIDNIIYEIQHKTRNDDDNLELIPYDRFKDLKLIGEGGFAEIYSATWLSGTKKKWSYRSCT